MIRTGRLAMDLYTWPAPVGIGEPYRWLAQGPGHRDSMLRMPLVLLTRGPRPAAPGAEAGGPTADPVREMIGSLPPAELGAGGPFAEEGDLRGALVLRTDSTTARHRMLAAPAVRAGRLRFPMLTWLAAYGTMPGDTLETRR